MPPREPVVLSRPAQLRAIRSPTAQHVLAALERVGRATAGELAGHVGVPAASLYYHLAKLERAGVLRAAERRATGGRDGVVWEVCGDEVVVDPDASGPHFLEELGRTARATLRAAERDWLAALDDDGTERGGPARNLSLHCHQSRLTRADRAELQRRIAALEAWLRGRDDPERGEWMRLTVAVAPARPRP